MFVKTKAVVRRCSLRKVFLEILQNSQEYTCATVSCARLHFFQIYPNFFTQTSFKYTQTNKLFLKLMQDFTIKLCNHVFIQLLYKKPSLFILTMTRPSDVQTFLTPYFFDLHLITAFVKMSSFQLLITFYLSVSFCSKKFLF